MRDLSEVMEQIRAREPLLHHRELVYSAETFDRETSEDFWEVGASGRVYSRAQVRKAILERLLTTTEDEMASAGWVTESHQLRVLGSETFLFTYVLHGQGRVTRRSTIWQRRLEGGWCALYHQGTVVQDN